MCASKFVNDVLCPNCCHVDTVQKVSAIVAAGTSEGVIGGRTLSSNYNISESEWSLGVGSFAGSSVNTTNLAKKLAAPELPPSPQANEMGCLAYGWLIFPPVFLFFLYLQERDRTKYRQLVQEWEPRIKTAKEKWNCLYYCHKCDGVFLPGQVPLVSIDRMGDFLYIDT
jgi:hypothetical protein